MELAELLASVREEIDDKVEPYLWEDAQLTRFLNQAVREAAVRARLLVESVRPEICQVALTEGQRTYQLHKSIILVRRAVLASRPAEPLLRTTTAALDGHSALWRDREGAPEYLVVDQQGSGKLATISPVPTSADTLQLTVLRYPLEAELLEGDSDEPAIGEEHHEHLVHWAAYRALNQRDVERESKADASDHLSLFEAYFGPRPTARELQRLAIDPLTGTTAHPF